jgi:hypothetical protein
MQASTRRRARGASLTPAGVDGGFGRRPGIDDRLESAHASSPARPARGDGPLRVEVGASLAMVGFTFGVCLVTAVAFSILLRVLG